MPSCGTPPSFLSADWLCSPSVPPAFYPCLSSLFCPSASRPLSATYLPVICGTLESRNSVPDRRLARRISPRFRANCLVPAVISSSSPIIVRSCVCVCVCISKGFFVSCSMWCTDSKNTISHRETLCVQTTFTLSLNFEHEYSIAEQARHYVKLLKLEKNFPR